MSRLTPAAPIVAILCSDSREVDFVAELVVRTLTEAGMVCAGFLQRDVPRPERSRCDMLLENISSGEAVGISEDRGPHARGCRLDLGELMRAMALARAALGPGTDLLVVNKFGKTEAEGGGFRPLIVDAIEQSVPVLVAVPWRNIDSWRVFAGEMAVEIRVDTLSGDGLAVCRQLGLLPDSSGEEEERAPGLSA